MDLRRLRTFITVVEQGTVSRAALRLRIAQPSLSRQIHELEAELGVRLFNRIRKRLILSGEGEQLLADCRKILSAVDSLGEHAQLLRRADAGVLKVATSPQTIDGVFSQFLHLYAARFPNVELKLSEAVGADLLAKLERGELHFGISLLRALEAKNPELTSLQLPPIEFLAAGHASLQLGSSGRIEIGNLAPHPLLVLESSFVVRNTFDAACRQAGFNPKISIESRSPHALLALAEAGHGVAIVPSVLPTHRYRLRIARILHQRKALREPLAVLWDRRQTLPKYAKEFCKSLNTYMRANFPISRPSARDPVRTAKRSTGRRT
jgi:LysR family nitrogen assimilation transcriptional regulator